MVNIITALVAVVDLDHTAHNAHNIRFCDRAVVNRDVLVEFLVQFIPPDPFKVVAALVKQLFFQECLGILQCGWVTGAQAFEELNQ